MPCNVHQNPWIWLGQFGGFARTSFSSATRSSCCTSTAPCPASSVSAHRVTNTFGLPGTAFGSPWSIREISWYTRTVAVRRTSVTIHSLANVCGTAASSIFCAGLLPLLGFFSGVVLGVLSRTKARLAPIPSLDQIPSPMRSRDPRPLFPHPLLSTNSLSRSSFLNNLDLFSSYLTRAS